jgi:2-oxoglutarate ferredoxin oxidoreductase subunit gamma
MIRKEILVSGFGGQGVVLAGRILGYAAVLGGLRASMLISHGTETRGGYVRSQVVISDELIDSPIVETPYIFCALSQSAYNRFRHLMGPDGFVFYERDLVSPQAACAARQTAVPAQSLAVKEFGSGLFANSIMLGLIFRRLELIPENLCRAALETVVPRDKDKNSAALSLGWTGTF